ncbi:hypothetical protein HOD50_10325 [Candidatus Bathyarchaeota archaeon]|jgi:hypothetical protein|nr:hypothetical protein [Candidatus Bathyarchaeota archaeon]MBT6605889.1 hypothetical protein [Candidatus Bathyarchaeota archaeon]
MQNMTVQGIQDVILQTQEDKTPRDMYIHKSPCADNEVGAVFFAISGTPPMGYAMYLTEGDMGTLHVFDNIGLKRKIMHCRISDLGKYKDSDMWDAQATKSLLGD